MPDETTISKVLKNMKITNKTIVKVPKNRNTPYACQCRIEWALTWRYLERAGVGFAYIDEAGFNICLTQRRGWATVGYTPEIETPNNREKNISLLATLIPGHKITSYLIKRNAITSNDVVNWMTSSLFPECRRIFGSRPVVIVMDNARCHGVDVELCIINNKFRFLKSIPYSPQMNPIERIFSQIKSFVSRRY